MKEKTDIVATLGPSSEMPEVLAALVKSGMSIARFNFSHGTHEWHDEVIERLRSIAPSIRILQDLCGPKIRTIVEQPILARPGDMITIAEKSGAPGGMRISIPDMVRFLTPGTRILVQDGTIELESISGDDQVIQAKVIRGGEIKANKGVNIPGVTLPVRSLTEKDIKDLSWGMKHGVDYIALSFVKTSQDIDDLRAFMNEYNVGKKPKILAKIETVEALQNLDQIIDVVDAVMVARGDLGVEIGLEKVPAAQKNMIALCNKKNIPVIVATQMFESMVEELVPTRAEVSDVFNAVLDGATGVMLSAESATGTDPVNVVRTMRRVCDEAETYKA